MSNQNFAITISPAADNAQLSLAIGGISDQLFRAAEQNVRAAIADAPSGTYTAVETRAMIAAEALRLTSGMDLAAILMRGEIIRQIETEGLASVHPNGYADLTALAQDMSISVAELSDTRALCDVIFPYITETLGRSIAEVWAEVGKSAFRELVPALRSLITGEQATHTSVQEAVTSLLAGAVNDILQDQNSIDAGLTAEDIPAEAVRRVAVSSLLHAGATLPVRELRRRVRPTRTPPMNATTLQVDETQWYAVLHITSQDQYDCFIRSMNAHMENIVVNGREENTARHRRLLSSMFGDSNE